MYLFKTPNVFVSYQKLNPRTGIDHFLPNFPEIYLSGFKKKEEKSSDLSSCFHRTSNQADGASVLHHSGFFKKPFLPPICGERLRLRESVFPPVLMMMDDYLRSLSRRCVLSAARWGLKGVN